MRHQQQIYSFANKLLDHTFLSAYTFTSEERKSIGKHVHHWGAQVHAVRISMAAAHGRKDHTWLWDCGREVISVKTDLNVESLMGQALPPVPVDKAIKNIFMINS